MSTKLEAELDVMVAPMPPMNRLRLMTASPGHDHDEAAILAETLTGSLRDFRDPRGRDLLGRVDAFYRWQNRRRQHGYWPYARSAECAPTAVCSAQDDTGYQFAGVNLKPIFGLALPPDRL